MTPPTATTDQAWPRASHAWWALAIFALAAVLSYTDRQILTLLIDPVRADLAISDTQVSLLQGLAFVLIYSIAGLPLGRAADIFPRRIVIIAGVTIWSLATVACAYVHSFQGLFTARIFVGIGEACLAPAAMSMIGDYFPPQRRGTAISIFMLGMVIGSGVAIMIGGGALHAVQHGLVAGVPYLRELPAWRAVLVLMALPGALMVLLLLTVREPARRLHAGQESAAPLPLKDVLADFVKLRHTLLPLYFGMALLGVCDAAMGNWIPALLSRRFGWDAGQIGELFGAASIAGAAIGVFGGGLLADRLVARQGTPARFTVALAAVLLGLPGAFCGLADSASMVLFGNAWWTMMSAAAATIAITALQDIVANHMRGVAIALASFGNIMLGVGIGTTLTPWINDHVFTDPLKVGAAMTLAAVPVALIALALYARLWRVTRLPRLQQRAGGDS